MAAWHQVLVAEQDMKRNQIAQQQALQDQQSKTRSAEVPYPVAVRFVCSLNTL